MKKIPILAVFAAILLTIVSAPSFCGDTNVTGAIGLNDVITVDTNAVHGGINLHRAGITADENGQLFASISVDGEVVIGKSAFLPELKWLSIPVDMTGVEQNRVTEYWAEINGTCLRKASCFNGTWVFDFSGLAPGKYSVRFVVKNKQGKKYLKVAWGLLGTYSLSRVGAKDDMLFPFTISNPDPMVYWKGFEKDRERARAYVLENFCKGIELITPEPSLADLDKTRILQADNSADGLQYYLRFTLRGKPYVGRVRVTMYTSTGKHQSFDRMAPEVRFGGAKPSVYTAVVEFLDRGTQKTVAVAVSDKPGCDNVTNVEVL